MKRWQGYTGLVLAGVGIALVVTLFSPWASSQPDGLEKVAEEQQFLDAAEETPKYEIIPGYRFPGIENERVATVLAGVTGVLVVAVLLIGAGMVLGRGKRDAGQSEAPSTDPR